MYYFAYGSNMSEERMRERKVKYFSRKRAILRGYSLAFNKVAKGNLEEGYANIVKEPVSVVEGVLYEIEEGGIKILDRYEGCPKHYIRKNVKVLVGDQEVEAVTYIAKRDKEKTGLKPSRSYLQYLLEGSDILSPKYKAKLRQVKTLD